MSIDSPVVLNPTSPRIALVRSAFAGDATSVGSPPPVCAVLGIEHLYGTAQGIGAGARSARAEPRKRRLRLRRLVGSSFLALVPPVKRNSLRVWDGVSLRTKRPPDECRTPTARCLAGEGACNQRDKHEKHTSRPALCSTPHFFVAWEPFLGASIVANGFNLLQNRAAHGNCFKRFQTISKRGSGDLRESGYIENSCPENSSAIPLSVESGFISE